MQNDLKEAAVSENRQRIQALLDDALKHEAINHPYLHALAGGDLPNPAEAVRDFSVQYFGYTSWFLKYLISTMSKLDNVAHQKVLLENLNEESGNLDQEEVDLLASIGVKEEWVQGIPHKLLFKRFQKALKIDGEQTLGMECVMWRELFLNVIEQGSVVEAIGAIGLGTECIVQHIYKYVLTAIKEHTDLTMEEYVFFELHSEIDDGHGEVILDIAEELLNDNPELFADLEKGMMKALNLRSMFWNGMHERARGM